MSVKKTTGASVRSHLELRGRKRGDLSKFVEEAVNWRIFELTLAEARDTLSDMEPAALQALIDEAVAAQRRI